MGQHKDELFGQQYGNYRCGHLIKKGGSAKVYKGTNVDNKTQAAIKIWEQSIEVEDFLKEVRAATTLNHRNIVEILDFGMKGGIPYLIMAYAPHGSLQGLPLPLSLDTTVEYVQQIADALFYAHQRGFIHRDIKPDNILLGPKNQIWVADFGIAIPTITRQDTMQKEPNKQIAGTLGYMAPERWNGDFSAASDQYALGVMTYQWLCGKLPFPGPGLAEFGYQHCYMSPPLLGEKLPTIPPAVEKAVRRTLEKDRANRFPDVKAFANALKQACPPPQLPLGREPLGPRRTARYSLDRPLSTTRASYTGHTGPINDVAWSPDGKYIVSGSDDQTMQVWHAFTGDVRFASRSHTGAVLAVAWSPDGKYIASVSENKRVQIWDTENAERLFIKEVRSVGPVTSYMPHLISSIETVTWSPDSKHIACIDQDGHIEIWDVLNGTSLLSNHLSQSPRISSGLIKKPLFELEAENANWTAAWSPDGKWIASYRRRNAAMEIHELLDYKSSPESSNGPLTSSRHMKELVWSSDSKYITVAHLSGRQVTVWVRDITEKPFVVSPATFDTAHTGAVLAVAWSPDDKAIASGGKDTTVQIWDQREKFCLYTYRGHTKAVRTVAWSPNSNAVASGSEDATVKVWGVPTV